MSQHRLPGSFRGGAAAPTLATAFDPRTNSLNFLRLLFASLVLAAHAWALGGFGLFNLARYPAGSFAVDGFFVISGFLITRSRTRTRSTVRYLWHRFLRIMPGFWVCLVVTAAVFGALGWRHEYGTLAGYLGAPHGPVQYVLENSGLKMAFYDIGGTPFTPHRPSDLPNGALWNGSLWTLYWEFLCYLGIAALAVLGLLRARRRVIVPAGALLLWVLLVVHHVAPSVAPGLLGSQQVYGLMRFVSLFLCGATLFLFGDRVPVSGPLAALSAAVVVVSLSLPSPELVTGIPLGYLCLWLGMRLPAPFRRIGARNDLSYGLYIYTFPVQQLFAVYDLPRRGAFVYVVVTTVIAFGLAAASWFAVERPALRLKNWTPGPLRRADAGPAPYPDLVAGTADRVRQGVRR